MGKFGKELIESMRQAAQHAEGGKARGMRVTTVEASRREGDPRSAAHVAAALRRSLPDSAADIEKLGAGPPLPGRAGRRLLASHLARAQSHQGSPATWMNGTRPTPLTRSFGELVIS